ncbi:hypothetical protein [Paenibacillus sp. GCM10027626]|uniref:hypothetical protein n=1 Tax=Paenibacillus sp. GCM10027626 TaxID=3273411 RepID=UPI0036254212
MNKRRKSQLLLTLPLAAAMMTFAALPAAAQPFTEQAAKPQSSKLQLNTMSMIVNGQALQVPAGLAGNETYIGLLDAAAGGRQSPGLHRYHQ